MRMAEAGGDNWRPRPHQHHSLHPQYFGDHWRPEQRQGRYRKKQSKKSTPQRFGIRKSSHQPQLFGSGSNLLSLNRLSRSETNLRQCHQLLGDCIRYGEGFLCRANDPIKFSTDLIRGMQSVWLNLDLVVEGVGLQPRNSYNSHSLGAEAWTTKLSPTHRLSNINIQTVTDKEMFFFLLQKLNYFLRLGWNWETVDPIRILENTWHNKDRF